MVWFACSASLEQNREGEKKRSLAFREEPQVTLRGATLGLLFCVQWGPALVLIPAPAADCICIKPWKLDATSCCNSPRYST